MTVEWKTLGAYWQQCKLRWPLTGPKASQKQLATPRRGRDLTGGGGRSMGGPFRPWPPPDTPLQVGKTPDPRLLALGVRMQAGDQKLGYGAM